MCYPVYKLLPLLLIMEIIMEIRSKWSREKKFYVLINYQTSSNKYRSKQLKLSKKIKLKREEATIMDRAMEEINIFHTFRCCLCFKKLCIKRNTYKILENRWRCYLIRAN